MLDGSLVQFARHVVVLVSPQSCAMPSGGWVFNRISHLMDSCSNHYINPNRKKHTTGVSLCMSSLLTNFIKHPVGPNPSLAKAVAS